MRRRLCMHRYVKCSDEDRLNSDCSWENVLMWLSRNKSCRECIPFRVHDASDSSGIKCRSVNVRRAVIFFQAWAEAFMVGDIEVGTGEPNGVLSNQFFRLGWVSEESSICPHSVVGQGWNQQGSWAKTAAK